MHDASIGLARESVVERLARNGLLRRRMALLGGTTTANDVLVALHFLIKGRAMVRGPEIARYEQAFARRLGVPYAYSFASGRVGLHAILKALGVGPGDEVLLQVPTHIVVPNAIRYLGATPVYVDCQLDTFNMDLGEAERKITPRTKILLVQHTFGIPVDMDAALSLASKHGLEVVEDCVHALGATYDGRQVGTFGRAAFFSTEETKTISSTMGGMVVTNDSGLAQQVEQFQTACRWPSIWLTARYLLKFALYYVLTQPHVHRYARTLYEGVGRRHPLPRPTHREELHGRRPRVYEQRLSNAQAALALRQLERLDSNLAHRRRMSNHYEMLLPVAGFEIVRPPAKAEPALVRYPVWVTDRPRAERVASPHAVLGTWFTSVLEEAASPEHGDYVMGSCPRAEAAAQHLVNLPTYPRATLKDAEVIVAAVASAEAQTKGRQA